MLIKNKRTKSQLPTEEEFLEFVPKRADYKWELNKKGLVEIKVPKFKSNFGKSFCKVIKKDNVFSAKMDKMGTSVWQECDGKKTVKQILKKINKKFPKEENLDQRLFFFLKQMDNLNYITLYKKKQ